MAAAGGGRKRPSRALEFRHSSAVARGGIGGERGAGKGEDGGRTGQKAVVRLN